MTWHDNSVKQIHCNLSKFKVDLWECGMVTRLDWYSVMDYLYWGTDKLNVCKEIVSSRCTAIFSLPLAWSTSNMIDQGMTRDDIFHELIYWIGFTTLGQCWIHNNGLRITFPKAELKRGFAGGAKFQKMTKKDNMSSYCISMGKVLNQKGFDEKSFYPRT